MIESVSTGKVDLSKLMLERSDNCEVCVEFGAAEYMCVSVLQRGQTGDEYLSV